MKNRVYKVFLVAATIVILAFGFAQLKTDNVEAALGNQGIPVACYDAGGRQNPGTTTILGCYTPVSPGFIDDLKVPSGYYFLVTDVFVTPDSSATTPLPSLFLLSDDGTAAYYKFRILDSASHGEHFNMPLLVLPAEHTLHVSGKITNTGFVDVRVTGMLVTNATYVPAIFSNP
ncbi:MAG: hypothetical protein BGO78_13220 [Chloroflexi bacterium 44-23]|nr:MAG: hypothetical protein BGO78_13220 [Chloroflexi bacterium 44-23]